MDLVAPLCGPDGNLLTSWNGALVALSYVVAVAGSFVSLEWADRMRSTADANTRRQYFLGGAALMGIAVWTMHFVGMLALHLGLTVRYDPLLSAASIIAAAVGAALAFQIINRPSVSAFHIGVGGLAMGVAIAAMHYLGMASMRMAATIRYDPRLFAASIGIAIAASAGAMSLARWPLAHVKARHWIKLGSALAMGIAIAGMHYVGMAAASYRPSVEASLGETAQVGGISLQNVLIAAGLVIGGALIAMAAKSAAERQDALTALEEKTAEAVAASRAKDIFLASLSHELRTPLNPALLLAGDAARNPNYPAEARAVFADIARNIALEARLIDDLLDLTRIERGKMKIESLTVDVEAVLKDAIRVVEPVCVERLKLELSFQAKAKHVKADPDRLKQVFWNLLQNAAKFSEPGTMIRVMTSNRDGRLDIEVADQGIGMTVDELAHCFDGFTQGEHRRGGLGMGLTISRKLLELMGGTIVAESNGRGQGATLRIGLVPVPPPSQGEVSASSRAPLAPSAMMKILVVEDHEASRVTVARLLQRRGHEVIGVGTVAKALAAAREQQFDLALCDIGLPDGDGYELFRALLRLQPLIGVAMTGYGMDEDIARATEAGFAAQLTKPVTIEKLNAMLVEVGARLGAAATN
jgi:signal transduction histidine kinase/CheY-like chemotaxis protein